MDNSYLKINFTLWLCHLSELTYSNTNCWSNRHSNQSQYRPSSQGELNNMNNEWKRRKQILLTIASNWNGFFFVDVAKNAAIVVQSQFAIEENWFRDMVFCDRMHFRHETLKENCEHHLVKWNQLNRYHEIKRINRLILSSHELFWLMDTNWCILHRNFLVIILFFFPSYIRWVGFMFCLILYQ